MRAWLWGVAVVLIAWLQVSAFGHLRPLGVMPNLMIIVVTLFALWANATPSIAVAVGGGFLLDLAAGDGNFGLRIAFFSVVTLAVVAARQLGLHADSIVTGLLIVALATILYNLAILATIGFPLSSEVFSRIGREIIDNTALAALVYVVRANIGSRGGTALELGARPWR